MCGSKPKKPKAPPKVVERDLKKEQAEAAAKATAIANEEAAAARRAKGAMLKQRGAGVGGTANTAAAGAKAGAKKLGG